MVQFENRRWAVHPWWLFLKFRVDRSWSSDVGPSGGPLFHSHECRCKAEEADELAQKATDPAVRTAYEEIARLWREMAERAEQNNW
jgi:hypothetical protein